MRSDVWFLPLPTPPDAPGLPKAIEGLTPGLVDLAARLKRGRDPLPAGLWLLKIQLGGPHAPPAVPVAWVAAVSTGLGLRGEVVASDSLSIQEAGLDQADALRESAQRKGFGRGTGPPFRVADDPGAAAVAGSPAGPDRESPAPVVAALATEAVGICVLNQVRPHPHLGLRGALAALGLELVDRQSKLQLHSGLKPRVDVPLCAGCGSCLAVCIWDAIRITGGRAEIDHQRCTGCGECQHACFLAGIRLEQETALPVFQLQAAEAARRVAANRRDRLFFFNFLIRQDRPAGGETRGGRTRLGDVGVLASVDPVALDRATWDLIAERVDGDLPSWSGFPAKPGALLEEAERAGLGVTAYRLRTLT